jgi:hypothetical protein
VLCSGRETAQPVSAWLLPEGWFVLWRSMGAHGHKWPGLWHGSSPASAVLDGWCSNVVLVQMVHVLLTVAACCTCACKPSSAGKQGRSRWCHTCNVLLCGMLASLTYAAAFGWPCWCMCEAVTAPTDAAAVLQSTHSQHSWVFGQVV